MKPQKASKEILKLTQKLVKIETTENHLANLDKIIDFCAAYFKGSHFYIKKRHYLKKPSLVILTKKTKQPHILMAGHLDVVPGHKKDFKPKIIKNKLYGRGTADMKTACATMMYAMRELAGQKGKSVGLILTTDEEVTNYNGTYYLVDKVGQRAKVVILPDGGYNFGLVTAQKGAFRFYLTAYGKGAHGSRPWLGESAIKRIFKAYRELRSKIPEPTHEHDWRHSVILTIVKGGEALNKVPAYCEAHFDLRFTEKTNIAYWEKEIAKIARRYKLEHTKGECSEAFAVNPEHELVRHFRRVSKKVLRKNLTLTPEAGASDAVKFSSHNIPVIITSIKGGNAHADDEWVDIPSISKFYQILHQYIDEVG